MRPIIFFITALFLTMTGAQAGSLVPSSKLICDHNKYLVEFHKGYLTLETREDAEIRIFATPDYRETFIEAEHYYTDALDVDRKIRLTIDRVSLDFDLERYKWHKSGVYEYLFNSRSGSKCKLLTKPRI